MIDEFLEELKLHAGEELASVVLYGAAAKGEVPKGGNVNVLVVLRRVELAALSRLAPAVRRALRKGLAPVFWTDEELRNSQDVFPIEFLDILKNRRVLFGADPLAEATVDTKNLRHQVEFELRSKLLRLRSEWLDAHDSKGRLESLLGQAGGSFSALFPHAQAVAGGKVPDAWKEPFERALKLKRKEVRLSREELQSLYREMHETVTRIAAAV